MFGFFVSPFLVMLRSTLLAMFLMMTIVLIMPFFCFVSCCKYEKRFFFCVRKKCFLERKKEIPFLSFSWCPFLKCFFFPYLSSWCPDFLCPCFLWPPFNNHLFERMKARPNKDKTRHLLFCIHAPRGMNHVSRRMPSHRPHQRTFSSSHTRLIYEPHAFLLSNGLSWNHRAPQIYVLFHLFLPSYVHGGTLPRRDATNAKCETSCSENSLKRLKYLLFMSTFLFVVLFMSFLKEFEDKI